ncbi:hydroxymethylglutaryl-CoA synthase 1-like [Artemia franciscana]|uniref:Hydroxymethylglutaryl-CoA synthase n=1 Tax=Artemia franciscana TaxID=6661 RepID=A0AA88I9I8_ARTSF|nr:hypothetical protein QYM36_001057 [Artemia franciscana]
MAWPENVGIVALDIYLPNTYVDQVELEEFDGASKGKYTIGLGQTKMGFSSDREDIQSICLNAVQRLIDKTKIGYDRIGHLQVGTETIIDKSKSVKTCLMQLFEESGNHDVEGLDTTNACYGGTAALFNAISWIESSAWDGRYALVVAGDIAVYASGSARPTGGCGAVAMLIGPNAPLVFDRGLRGSFFSHAYDFYKPDLKSEFPVVDGKLSIQCYLQALDNCYRIYCNKFEAQAKKAGKKEKVTVDTFDAFCFHAPYCKLVQKSFARLYYNDLLHVPVDDIPSKFSGLENFRSMKPEETYFNRELEQAFMGLSKEDYEKKIKPSLHVSTNNGNMYTASLYGCLVSLLTSQTSKELAGQRVALFSYGSGLASTFYSLTIRGGEILDKLVSSLNNVRPEMEARVKVSPTDFAATLQLREDNCHKAPYVPAGNLEYLRPGTWYLKSIDDMYRRTYDRIPVQQNGLVQ